MTRAAFWLLAAPALFSVSLAGQARQDRSSFRIIGYYSLRAATTADPATVPFDELTHVNLSFLNPDPQGSFTQDYSGIAPFVDEAHRHGVKVLASIGGGGAHPYYHELLSDEKRPAFVEHLLSAEEMLRLDGIDVDLEGRDIDEHYEAFVSDLARMLHARNKLVTAAIAVFYKDSLSDGALATYDFVNIMSYDHTGPWRPEKPGPHAPYAEAENALAYFGGERKIPKEKLVLGVPFYGYGFGPLPTSPAVSMNYRQIVETFAGSETADEWDMPGDKVIYYNGVSTIRKKTALARDRASGVMIWQLLGDAPGDKSLLAAINDVAYGK